MERESGTPVLATALGFDVGGTSIKWVVRETDETVASGEIATPSTCELDVVSSLVGVFACTKAVETIGIGLAAVVDESQG